MKSTSLIKLRLLYSLLLCLAFIKRRIINYRILLSLLFVIGALPMASHAQVIYEGQVIDNNTELPIPAVTVTLVKKKVSSLANDQGYFKLVVNDIAANDELIFTSIGYKSYSLPVKNFKSEMFIKLTPVSNMLNQVNISGGKATLEKFSMADVRYYDTKYRYVGLIIGSPLALAKLFEAPKDNVQLKSIQLGRADHTRDLLTNYTNARFLVHVYSVNAVTGAPDKVLFTKDVTLQDKSRIVLIDLTKDHVIIPYAKFFIAIEWLFIPFNEVFSINYKPKNAYTNLLVRDNPDDTAIYVMSYQPFLAYYNTYNKQKKLWSKKSNGDWVMLTSTSTLALSAAIFY
jgi:hypothetical protein